MDEVIKRTRYYKNKVLKENIYIYIEALDLTQR